MRPEKSTLEVLAEARSLIEKGWARGAFARYRNGKRCGSMDERAACFCVEGAICRAAFGTVYARREAMKAMQAAAGTAALHKFNDAQPSKKPVLAAFDRAIAQVDSTSEVKS